MGVVVFDLDGTLADTSADLLGAANACFRGLGHGDVLTDADAATAVRGGRAMLRLGFERVGIDWTDSDVDRQFPLLLDYYGQAIAVQTRLYPGAVETVEALRAAGHATAICTNKPEGLARRLMDELGAAHLFDALVGADTLPVRKPDPAPYRLAVDRAGGGRSLLVGDTVTDRETARNAGVPIALVTFGPGGDAVRGLGADVLLDRFADLPGIAARLL